MAQKFEGKNIADIQRLNRTLVLRTIIRQKCTTQKDIAAMTGLNKATVSNIMADLQENGAIRQVGVIKGRPGRRSVQIELVAEKYITICVWLTRRHFVVGAYDLYGREIESQRFSVGIYSPVSELLEQIVHQIQEIEKKYKSQYVTGVAIAVPGPYIKREGKIALLTNRSEWQKVDIAQSLREALDIPVFTQHDSDSAVVAEWMHMNHCDEDTTLLCVMVGHGIGGGVVEKGQLISGNMGLAGEIGHMSICYDGPRCECGNYGCLEKYCTSYAILERMRSLLPEYPETVLREDAILGDVINGFHQKDALSVRVIEEAAKYLAYGLVNLINLYNPKRIVIGDELSDAGEAFLNLVRQTISTRLISRIYHETEIELSTLKNSVLQGVCISYVDEVIRQPEIFTQPQ